MTPEETQRRQAIMERMKIFYESKHMSRREFELTTRIGRNYLGNVSVISKPKLALITKKYPELNVDWLLTGNGSMTNDVVNFSPQSSQYQLLLRHNQRLLEQVKDLTMEVNRLNDLLFKMANETEKE